MASLSTERTLTSNEPPGNARADRLTNDPRLPGPARIAWEDDVESVAEPFFGLLGASDVIVFPFSGPLIFPSGAGRRSRCTESFQAGKIVFGTSRQQGLRPILSLQVCRMRPMFAHNRRRYPVQKKSPILTQERPYHRARYYE